VRLLLAWNFDGGGTFLPKSGLRADLLGLADQITPDSFTDTTDILGSLMAFNYATQTLIETVSFSSIEGTLLGGGDLSVIADGRATVNGVATDIVFEAAVHGGVASFEIMDLGTGDVLAGGQGEPGRSGFGLRIGP
jgi:hypothetical protein